MWNIQSPVKGVETTNQINCHISTLHWHITLALDQLIQR